MSSAGRQPLDLERGEIMSSSGGTSVHPEGANPRKPTSNHVVVGVSGYNTRAVGDPPGRRAARTASNFAGNTIQKGRELLEESEKSKKDSVTGAMVFRPYEMLPEEAEVSGKDQDQEKAHLWLRLRDRIIVSGRDDPFSGKWYYLDIMATERSVEKPRSDSTWFRHAMSRNSPLWVRLIDWPYYPVKVPHGNGFRYVSPIGGEQAWKLLVGYLAVGVVAWVGRCPAPVKIPYMFAPLLYKYEGYAKQPRNAYEKEGRQFMDDNATEGSRLPDTETRLRCIWPSYLMELIEPEVEDLRGYNLHNQSEYMAPTAGSLERRLLDYLFISYSSKHFPTSEHWSILHQVGERVARQKKMRALWSSVDCVKEDKPGLSLEVYKISDIIRSAAEVIIVLPWSSRENIDESLKEWGERLWTFPEVLLCHNRNITVYVAPAPGTPSADVMPVRLETYNKYALAERAWPGEAEAIRQLIDHYIGTIQLSRLELAYLSLRFLQSRPWASQPKFPGDATYVIMGMYRNRPATDQTLDDTPFQAFARLSLAGDSDRLLERAISMQTPESESGRWLCLRDEFGCSLWDIEPRTECSVAAICEDDTIVLDGARGAAIRWNKFPRELSYPAGQKASWWLLLPLPLWIISVSLLASFAHPSDPGGGGPNPEIATAVFLFFASFIMVFASPALIRSRWKRNFIAPQPWLFGFEGHLTLDMIEHLAFGRTYNQLRWSPHGSSLSVHRRCDTASVGGKQGMRTVRRGFQRSQGVDPATDPHIKAVIDACDDGGQGHLKVFTIVDTVSMQVTLIRSRKPPVAAIVCASEGGMQRAVLCSYDMATNTLERETVMRLETPTVDKMHAVNRIKFRYRPMYAEMGYAQSSGGRPQASMAAPRQPVRRAKPQGAQ